MYLPKSSLVSNVRESEDWELPTLPKMHSDYASLDVYASHLTFGTASKVPKVNCITVEMPAGTPVTVLSGDGTQEIAVGTIRADRPFKLDGVVVRTKVNSRLVIQVEEVLMPSAAAVLYLPSITVGRREGLSGRERKASTKLLREFGHPPFLLVVPCSCLALQGQAGMKDGTSNEGATPGADNPRPQQVRPFIVPAPSASPTLGREAQITTSSSSNVTHTQFSRDTLEAVLESSFSDHSSDTSSDAGDDQESDGENSPLLDLEELDGEGPGEDDADVALLQELGRDAPVARGAGKSTATSSITISPAFSFVPIC